MKISEIELNTGQIGGLPKNPRFIRDDRFKALVKSIQDDPEMLDLRECIVYPHGKKYVVIAGNMRLRACKELGLKDVPVKILPIETPIEKLRAYTIKDNVSFGDVSWDDIANEWDTDEVEGWGMEIPINNINEEDFGTDFKLKEGDKAPFQQMTFTLADEQANKIKNAIAEIKQSEEYKHCETFGNENSNGNALYLIIMQWAEQRK